MIEIKIHWKKITPKERDREREIHAKVFKRKKYYWFCPNHKTWTLHKSKRVNKRKLTVSLYVSKSPINLICSKKWAQNST